MRKSPADLSDGISRRDLLRAASGAMACALGGVVPAAQASQEELLPPENAVDHLLFGCADLDAGIRWVEDKTGVRANIGGVHPGVGTRNALVALGGRRYLEIIALDPAQTTLGPMAQRISKLTAPKLITWAANSAAIAALAKRAAAAGIEVYGPRPGSRQRPDGRELKWSSMQVNTDLGDIVPFFIEWAADSLHPSEDSPKGCRLGSLQLLHPDPKRAQQFLRKLGIDARVRRAAETGLRAVLATPRGPAELA